MTVTTRNAFSGSNTVVEAHGLVGCVRLLAAPELLLHMDAADAALVESWLQTTEATLLPLLRSSSAASQKGASYRTTVRARMAWHIGLFAGCSLETKLFVS